MSRATERQAPELNVLNWNIRNPSIKRAVKQIDWIIKTNANIILLTEAKCSEGGEYIRDRLTSFGYDIFFPKPEKNDYCVIAASKNFSSKELESKLHFLNHRLVSIVCETFLGRAKIIGIYVPSRGPMEKRNVNKRKFLDQAIDLLKRLSDVGETNNLIIGGDLNVIERNHVPHYPIFGDWEYEFYESFGKFGLVDAYRLVHPCTQEHSWFGKQGDGYRFDHFFVSKELSPHVVECLYIHETRLGRLSDHSAMWLKLT